jgi:hypothetical protein
VFFCQWQDEDPRPEPVEIIVQAFQALVEDGHILGVLGLTESAFEGAMINAAALSTSIAVSMLPAC